MSKIFQIFNIELEIYEKINYFILVILYSSILNFWKLINQLDYSIVGFNFLFKFVMNGVLKIMFFIYILF